MKTKIRAQNKFSSNQEISLLSTKRPSRSEFRTNTIHKKLTLSIFSKEFRK